MKSKVVHFALIALGAIGTVLTFLGSVPKYAGFAAGGLLLVGDVKKLLGGQS